MQCPTRCHEPQTQENSFSLRKTALRTKKLVFPKERQRFRYKTMFFQTPFLFPKPPQPSTGPVSKTQMQILFPGYKNDTQGPKTKTDAVEQPCGIPVLDLRMEAYGANHCPRTSWASQGERTCWTCSCTASSHCLGLGHGPHKLRQLG